MHVYINDSFIFICTKKKWILECIYFRNFNTYCSETKHKNVQSSGGPQRMNDLCQNKVALMVALES